jgi:hypothetical protein
MIDSNKQNEIELLTNNANLNSIDTTESSNNITDDTDNTSTSDQCPIDIQVNNNSHQYNKTHMSLPMISLPENDNYWEDSCKIEFNATTNNNTNDHDLNIISSSSAYSTSTSSSPSPSPSSQSTNSISSFQKHKHHHNNANSTNTNGETVLSSSLDFDSYNEQNYKDAFIGKEHLIFYGRDKTNEMPLVLSYRIHSDVDNNNKEIHFIKAILRTREMNHFMTTPLANVDEPVTPLKICKILKPDLKIKTLYPLLMIDGHRLIQNFDAHTVTKKLKFGVIYMKKGQTTEEELFSNQDHSKSFDDFLNLIGRRIKLKDFDGFRAGLDTTHGQTGEYSVYENYNDKEIMFHVSTLLPFNKNDQQQLERKRHIGNDIVTIVFQEDNTPFAPDMIASNFLHAFIVVQHFKDPLTLKSKYRVSVTARKDVPNFGPTICNNGIYENDDFFKDWILNKLINAEDACCKADKFRKLRERTRTILFESLFKDLTEKNSSIIGSIFPTVNLSEELNGNLKSIVNDISNFSSNSRPFANDSGFFTSTSSADSKSIQSGQGSTHNNQNNVNLNSQNSFKLNFINSVKKVFKKDSNKDHNLSTNRSYNNNSNKVPLTNSVSLNHQNMPSSYNQEDVETIHSVSSSSSSNNKISNNFTSHLSFDITPSTRSRNHTFDASSEIENNPLAAIAKQNYDKTFQKSRKLSKNDKVKFVCCFFLIF